LIDSEFKSTELSSLYECDRSFREMRIKQGHEILYSFGSLEQALASVEGFPAIQQTLDMPSSR
jgi:hypothetical protein